MPLTRPLRSRARSGLLIRSFSIRKEDKGPSQLKSATSNDVSKRYRSSQDIRLATTKQSARSPLLRLNKAIAGEQLQSDSYLGVLDVVPDTLTYLQQCFQQAEGELRRLRYYVKQTKIDFSNELVVRRHGPENPMQKEVRSKFKQLRLRLSQFCVVQIESRLYYSNSLRSLRGQFSRLSAATAQQEARVDRLRGALFGEG